MADGLSTGVGLSTAFSGKLDRFYQIAQTNAAQLAAAKAAADKRAADDDAKSFAKYKDLAVIDPTKYTPKYLPIAQKATIDLVNGLVEAKRADPNNWTNNAPKLIAEFNEKANFAYNQSEAQRGLEKLSQEYNIPEKLKAAYNSNYGDTSDLAKLAPELADYGIIVDQSGAVSGQPYKRFDLNGHLKAITANEDLYIPTQKSSWDKTTKKSVVDMTLTMKPEVFENLKTAAYSDPQFISYVRTNPSDRAILEQKRNQLLTSNPNMNPAEADLKATYSVIDDKLASIQSIKKMNIGGGQGGNTIINMPGEQKNIPSEASVANDKINQSGYVKWDSIPVTIQNDLIKNWDKNTNQAIVERKDKDGNKVLYTAIRTPDGKRSIVTRTALASAKVLDIASMWNKQGDDMKPFRDQMLLTNNDELYDADLQKAELEDDRSYSPTRLVAMKVNGKKGYYIMYAGEKKETFQGETTTTTNIFYKKINPNDSQAKAVLQRLAINGKVKPLNEYMGEDIPGFDEVETVTTKKTTPTKNTKISGSNLN